METEFSDDLRRNVKGRHYLPVEQQLVNKKWQMMAIQDKEFLSQEIISPAELLSQLNYNKMYHHLVLVHPMYTHGGHHLVTFKDHLLPNQDLKLQVIVPMTSHHRCKVSVMQGLKNVLSNHPGHVNFLARQVTFHCHWPSVWGLCKSSY